MCLRVLVILTVTIISMSHGANKKKGQDPLKLSATDTEMLWLKDDGSYKMAYDAPNGFRAEVRDAVGGLKGVYGWRDQEGKLVTKTFMNDENGFRYTDFSELGIELPQLPYNMHPMAGQRKFPKHDPEGEMSEEPVEIVQSKLKENNHVPLHPFGKLNEDIEAVIVEPALKVNSDSFRSWRNHLDEDSHNAKDFSDVVIEENDEFYDTNDYAVGALAGPPTPSERETYDYKDYSDVVLIENEDNDYPVGALAGPLHFNDRDSLQLPPYPLKRIRNLAHGPSPAAAPLITINLPHGYHGNQLYPIVTNYYL